MRRPRPARRRGLRTIALGFGLLPDGVHAHAMLGDINDFYGGLLHPLITPEHLLAIIAVGLLAGQQGSSRDQSVAWLMTFALALASGALLAWRIGLMVDVDVTIGWMAAQPIITLVNFASLVVIGLLVAAARRLPSLLLYMLATVFGLTHGAANGVEITDAMAIYLFIPGLAVGTALAGLYSMVLADFVQHRASSWPSIALRVAGSWIAAIGLLIFGLTWRAFMTP